MPDEEFNWAAYVLHDYFDTERYFAGFAPGSYVVDVGCGDGEELEKLARRGCRVAGVEVTDELVEAARRRGVQATRASAEALPFESGSVDGMVFKGVLPYTNERAAFAEIARVLKPGGRLEALYLGAGFGVRGMLEQHGFWSWVYGLRSTLSTITMGTVGHSLPGFIGDTKYISHARLARYYREYGFTLLGETPSPTYRGLPVFIYHSVERTGGER